MAAAWCCRMTRRARLARWFKHWRRMVSPYIRWFLSAIAVLAVCNRMAWQLLHKPHFSHSAAWIFYKVILRFQLFYQFDNVRIDYITLFSIVALWSKVAANFFCPVFANCRNRVSSAIWRSPNHIRHTAAQVYYLLRSKLAYIGI